jgi:hypothetical protein
MFCLFPTAFLFSDASCEPKVSEAAHLPFSDGALGFVGEVSPGGEKALEVSALSFSGRRRNLHLIVLGTKGVTVFA